MQRVFVCTLALVCVGMRSIEAVDALESQRALLPVGAGSMGCVKRPASRFLHPALSALRLSGGAGQKRPSTPSKSPNAGKKHAGDDGADGVDFRGAFSASGRSGIAYLSVSSMLSSSLL